MSGKSSLPSEPLTPWLSAQQQPPTSSSVIDHFLLQFQSLHTRRNYSADLSAFFAWWQHRGVPLHIHLHEVSEKHVLLWLEQYKESSTRARKLASLSSFFRFCEKRKFIPQNPCQLIKRPRSEQSNSAQALTEEETVQLLQFLFDSAFEKNPQGRHAQRQNQAAHLRFAIIHTLFSVGMRVDELCELRISDLLFHPPAYQLRFVSKGGEEHTTTVSEQCAEVILNYLKKCRAALKPEDYVFTRVQTSQKKNKLSQTAIFKMIRETAAAAGINKTLSPHSARATVATVLHRQGVPLAFIQNLLNHKQITTTAHYVKKANERNESAALKAPVSMWLSKRSEN